MAKRVNLKSVGKKVLELLCMAGAFDCFHENRSYICPSIPEMVKFSEGHHKAKDEGQKLLSALMKLKKMLLMLLLGKKNLKKQ